MLPNGQNVTFPKGPDFKVVTVPYPAGDGVTVYKRGKKGAARWQFPPGSIAVINDPPSPAAILFSPNATPVDLVDEADTLAALGVPDVPESQVFDAPVGIFLVESPSGLDGFYVESLVPGRPDFSMTD